MGLFRKDYNKQMRELQASMLGYAEEIANLNDATLDYTDESMKTLDAMLPHITKEHHDAGFTTQEEIMSQESAHGIAEALGFYIAECIERNHGAGEWIKDPEGHNWPLFKVHEHLVVTPIDWVMKKIINPDEYSLANVYSEYIR